MAIYEFITSKKILATRRALDFWYKTLRGQMSVVDFLSYCEWSDDNGQVKLVYNSDRLMVKLLELK